ncbi:MAG: phenylacetic acid degradation bifunctional protein PaaZ [Xanthomonadales bacterium]|nr:phenylacetic acid degradation bifunctional protein PaaZ [Xanthomonadales bacterium]
MRNLESYASGAWTGSGVGPVQHNAITGEAIARVSSEGVDFKKMLAYGRAVGGPALRKLTFHERALKLKELGKYLNERKKAYYPVSIATGATKMDSMIDVDGGFGTLFSYSSKGRRELPNSTMLLDGAPEMLSRGGTFVGQHVMTPLQGVAVHINAFNFPVWGMLEKLAVSLLAGIPSIVKPASQTAYLTELVFRDMIKSGIFPEGSLQLICGGVGDLFDHLTGQDVVTFTGSASTGQKLRAHPAIVRNSVRFTMEADSLNCSILGPDATEGAPEFDLYIKEVAKEMTTKCGQKCTAIRRAFVPRAQVTAVLEALKTRLGRTVIGDPSVEGVTMGALASARQRNEVRTAVGQLREYAELVFGDPDLVNVEGADAETGAFISPIVLYCDAPKSTPAVHEIEAFGPVCTVMPYDSPEEAVELAAMGEGSLVGSVMTNDPDFARTIVVGAAAHHGRILFLNRECAKESTGHGSPLPVLVHGGPGRAGGGEEMGGVRGVRHYMQRTALQGSPAMLSAVAGQYLPGAPRHEGSHPFRKNLEELQIGDSVHAGPRTVTLADIEHFAEFTGDTFYAHMDEVAAAANPFFGGRVAHGYYILSIAAGLFVQPDPGPVLANYGLDNLRFVTPAKPGDELSVTLTCKSKKPRITEGYGEVAWDTVVTNQRNEIVATYDVLTMVEKSQA